jgi:hypothetical protein
VSGVHLRHPVGLKGCPDAGQITGRVRDGVTGEVLAFVATPVVN